MPTFDRPLSFSRAHRGAIALSIAALLALGGPGPAVFAADAAAYTLSTGTQSADGGTYVATATDASAVTVSDGATATLTGATITKTGDTSSADDSSFHGLNAAALVTAGSSLTLVDTAIQADAAGANGAFANGSGATLELDGVTISANGDGAHAVMATEGGTVTLIDTEMTTTGAHSGAVATDRGSGTITMTGGSAATSGADSPAIYSTGAITASGATLSASGAEAAVIEGSNSITLTDSDLSSTFDGKWGVMLYQSFSGDAEGSHSTFTMTGGSLSYDATTGPLFFVTNATGEIVLSGVDVTSGSGVLLQAAATDRWGNAGANGGHAILTASGETLTGDVVADDISSASVTLTDGSSLTGTVTNAGLSLDASSTWTVTADSTLTTLADADGVAGMSIANIVGNGHTVTYDASLADNAWLAGGTYTLSGGGTLTPA
ncbi:MAG: hypothetical protein U0869_25200 [Chloroflexota bacterium]